MSADPDYGLLQEFSYLVEKVWKKNAVSYENLNTDSQDVQNNIINEHNTKRRNTNPPAADMQRIAWNKTLAKIAKRIAATCSLNHSEPHERLLNDNPCGENIAISPFPVPWRNIITIWDNEKYNFTYGGGAKNGTVTGHYTQISAANTFICGCAVTKCVKEMDYYFYVCNYYTAGNRPGKEAYPYTKGEPCSLCDTACDGNNLCKNYCEHQDDYQNCGEAIERNVCDHPVMLKNCTETCLCKRKKKKT
ncbi:cysteine-rich venom protein-like [Leptodactylus fuscus]|uniref:cysteine-rich venom protein-like n=1 Tax=Leptodactylus fuscus TaxID=238119 RepID=UPI003F4EF82A